MVPTGEPGSGMNKDPRQQNREVSLIVNPGEGRVKENSGAIVQGKVHPRH